MKEEKVTADAKVADAKADAAESQKQTAETNKQITALREEKAENQRKHQAALATIKADKDKKIKEIEAKGEADIAKL